MLTMSMHSNFIINFIYILRILHTNRWRWMCKWVVAFIHLALQHFSAIFVSGYSPRSELSPLWQREGEVLATHMCHSPHWNFWRLGNKSGTAVTHATWQWLTRKYSCLPGKKQYWPDRTTFEECLKSIYHSLLSIIFSTISSCNTFSRERSW